MNIYKSCCLVLLLTALINFADAQSNSQKPESEGWFSLGARSTLSTFDQDGTGIGSGGQCRMPLSNRVNTDWYADYINIHIGDYARSEYVHIGWSVLYYLTNGTDLQTGVRPYVLAGHCFDYNKKASLRQPTVSRDRWGSAVQAGLGTHFNLTTKFDVSLTCQYMIHLTKDLEATNNEGVVEIHKKDGSSFEGHMLATLGINYKIFRLWQKRS